MCVFVCACVCECVRVSACACVCVHAMSATPSLMLAGCYKSSWHSVL